jgi:S-formylglutathione hydrolase FrmB
MKTLIHQVRTLTVVGIVLAAASISGVANAQSSLINQAISPDSSSAMSSQTGSRVLETTFGGSQSVAQDDSPMLSSLSSSLNKVDAGSAYAVPVAAPKAPAEVGTKTATVPGFDILSIFAGTMTVGMLFVRQRRK